MSLDTAAATVILNSLTATFDREARAATPFYPTITTRVNSMRDSENYGWLGAMPGMREWLGDRLFKQLRAAQYSLANKTWENSLLISKENLEDDVLGMYGPVLADLAAEATHHPDELVITALVNGESTACFDGQFFFDTDHSWGDSGTQDNDLTSNIVTANDPTAAEFKTAYHAAREALVGFKNDQGKNFVRPIVTGLSDLLILVPPNMQQAATEAVEAQLLGGGDTNIVLDRPRIVTSPLLTADTKWYLFNLAGSLRPLVFQARRPLGRQMKGLDDRETKDVKFMADARYNVGYLAWWNAVLTTFT